MTESTLGIRLKELRSNINKTQEQVAKSLGISRAAYSHIENSRNEPDNSTLAKIADYYGVTADFLLGRTSDKHEEVLAAAHLDKDLKDMTQEQRKAVYDFIEFQKKRIDREEDGHKE